MALPFNGLGIGPNDWWNEIVRLGLAAVSGGAIGWNRQANGKAGGLRTHMLVSLGAAIFVVIPIELDNTSASGGFSRAIQGVATGVGFLGAGEIVHQATHTGRQAVKGLTSAASIWVTAALGMAAACGLWQVCVVGTLLTLGILSVAKWLERWIPNLDREERE